MKHFKHYQIRRRYGQYPGRARITTFDSAGTDTVMRW